MGGMVKTSVYLDDELKTDLDRVSALTGRSLADLLRDGAAQVVHDHLRRRPAMQAGFSAPGLVGKADELLETLGE
jgi:predicted transcriptional regulator